MSNFAEVRTYSDTVSGVILGEFMSIHVEYVTQEMREVLSVGVGNVGCWYLSEYFNRLNDYLPLEEYNKNVLFTNQQQERHKQEPRVIFIDNIDGFNRLEDTECKNIAPSSSSSSCNIKKINPLEQQQQIFHPLPKKTNSNIIKPWCKDYLFCNQMKDYNYLPLDDYPNDKEIIDNNTEITISEHQQIINNIMLCEQITTNNNAKYIERIDECLRKNVEQCDSLSGFQLVTDMCSPYFMLKCDLIDHLNDDYTSKVILDFSLENDDKKLPKITKGFQSIVKLMTTSHFYQNKPNCFIPYNNSSNLNSIDTFVDCVHQLNSLWTLPNKNQQNSNYHHSLNQFIYDITNIAFGGASVGGLIGCALDPTAHQFNSLVNQLDSWSQLEHGLEQQLQPTHSLLPHTNELYTQYLCVGECKLGTFGDFSSKLSKCKWNKAINLHIPPSGLSTRDMLDGFLRYNYYGVKSYSFVTPKLVECSKNKVVSFFNGKQSYNYIHDIYVNSEKCLNAFTKRIAITDQYKTNYNKDNIDDKLCDFLKLLTSYDSTRAYEDFGEEYIDYD